MSASTLVLVKPFLVIQNKNSNSNIDLDLSTLKKTLNVMQEKMIVTKTECVCLHSHI